jgi:hypothetical protein
MMSQEGMMRHRHEHERHHHKRHYNEYRQ